MLRPQPPPKWADLLQPPAAGKQALLLAMSGIGSHGRVTFASWPAPVRAAATSATRAAGPPAPAPATAATRRCIAMPTDCSAMLPLFADKTGSRASVIGAGLAGLTAAKALSGQFDSVTVLERDNWTANVAEVRAASLVGGHATPASERQQANTRCGI